MDVVDVRGIHGKIRQDPGSAAELSTDTESTLARGRALGLTVPTPDAVVEHDFRTQRACQESLGGLVWTHLDSEQVDLVLGIDQCPSLVPDAILQSFSQGHIKVAGSHAPQEHRPQVGMTNLSLFEGAQNLRRGETLGRERSTQCGHERASQKAWRDLAFDGATVFDLLELGGHREIDDSHSVRQGEQCGPIGCCIVVQEQIPWRGQRIVHDPGEDLRPGRQGGIDRRQSHVFVLGVEPAALEVVALQQEHGDVVINRELASVVPVDGEEPGQEQAEPQREDP